jgi:hypothetical protein
MCYVVKIGKNHFLQGSELWCLCRGFTELKETKERLLAAQFRRSIFRELTISQSRASCRVGDVQAQLEYISALTLLLCCRL